MTFQAEAQYMNPNTGSVDSLDGWDLTLEEALEEGLVKVVYHDNGDEWVEESKYISDRA